VTNAAFPALFQAADAASLSAQKTYLGLFKGTLLLLLVGALLGSFSAAGWQQTSRVASAVLFGVSIVLNATMKMLAPEKTWFGARAIAESVKSSSWRYMAGGEPYGHELAPKAADESFLDELRSIMAQKTSLAWDHFNMTPTPQITGEMRTRRQLPTAERLQFYLTERIKDQREWYASKAVRSQASYLRWFWLTMAGQVAALTSAILMTRVVDSPANLTGALSAVSAAFMAWLQVKKYQELAQSYALAAHELGIIEAQATHLGDEHEVAAFVANAENAISREHTMWIARRDVG
jgi:hypothetical protein